MFPHEIQCCFPKQGEALTFKYGKAVIYVLKLV